MWLIASMQKEIEQHIKIKIAIALKRLLNSCKHYQSNDNDKIAKSYNKIALHADVRKATVSDAFNAKSVPKTLTLILIVEAMGFKLYDFAKIYDTVKEQDILEFHKIVKKD